MTFHSPGWLWFGIAALGYVAILWYSRRYRPARLTYGRIWIEALRKTGGATTNVFWRILSVLLAFAMLGATVLALSGLSQTRPGRAPHDAIIAIDTSPSTMRIDKDGHILDRLIARAQALINGLDPLDRVWLVASSHSRPVVHGPYPAGPYGEHVQRALSRIEPDFESCPAAALRSSIEHLLNENGAVREHKIVLCLSDGDQSFVEACRFDKVTTYAELSGETGLDPAFIGVERIDDVTWRVRARGKAALDASYADAGAATDAVAVRGSGIFDVSLADCPRALTLRLLPEAADAVPDNNTIVFEPATTRRATITTVTSGLTDARTKLVFEQLAHSIDAVSVAGRDRPDIVLASGIDDTPLPGSLLVAVGTLPAALGAVRTDSQPLPIGGIVRVPSWLYGQVEAYTVSDTPIDAVRTLADTSGWEILLGSPDGRALIAARRFGGMTALFIASGPGGNGLIETPQVALLVRRLLGHTQEGIHRIDPGSALIAGTPVSIPCDAPVDVAVRSPFLERERAWRVVPSENNIVFANTHIPGRYEFRNSSTGSLLQTRELRWVADEAEIPYQPRPAQRFGQWPLSDPLAREHSLAPLLLTVAIGLLVIEWALYWMRVTV